MTNVTAAKGGTDGQQRILLKNVLSVNVGQNDVADHAHACIKMMRDAASPSLAAYMSSQPTCTAAYLGLGMTRCARTLNQEKMRTHALIMHLNGLGLDLLTRFLECHPE